jgi:hypothetical protein
MTQEIVYYHETHCQQSSLPLTLPWKLCGTNVVVSPVVLNGNVSLRGLEIMYIIM